MSVVSRLFQSLTRRVEAGAGRTLGRTAGSEVGEQAARTLGRDALKTSGRAVLTAGAEGPTNPAFTAAMDAVRDLLKQKGRYHNVSGPLQEALAQAATTGEALQVATVARKLAVGYNRVHRGVLTDALAQGAARAQVTDEAFDVIRQVVRTRQEAYALFNVAERRKLVETAVARYMEVGEAELPVDELARKVVKLVKPRLDQASTRATIRRVTRLETLVQRVQAVTNFIHKALS
ncbi:MAG: hypothetical protein VKQ33_11805 [Candidatus Sericytochromatia bacterium]|nr:hypothetical protein [Candidatus Sericytochromatia bacterium]